MKVPPESRDHEWSSVALDEAEYCLRHYGRGQTVLDHDFECTRGEPRDSKSNEYSGLMGLLPPRHTAHHMRRLFLKICQTVTPMSAK